MPERFLTVGLGASAGGISALSEFLGSVPKGSGMSFAVVTHLSPSRKSLLHEVLAGTTALDVRVIADGDEASVDTVHVMPEGKLLTMEDGVFRLADLDLEHRERKPIDIFFSSLGVERKEWAAGIVMSGGDGDGTLGVKVIKEQGGITFAQTEGELTTLNPEMPRSAIASGFVDFAVPVSSMFEKLALVRDGQETLGALVLSDDGARKVDTEEVQSTISAILSSQTGHDFSGYKGKTFFRRVARRMQVRQVGTLQDYCTVLREETDEVTALFRDLLISVTSFFRDTDAFEAVQTLVIPKLLEDRNPSNPLRVWVPACTTGEEVYSIAILLREHLAKHPNPVRIQVFATDIDEAALGVARQGRYPEQLLTSVSPERLARYFHADGAGYVVNKEVRDMCIFSPHNVIGDPPFSRMDLVSCRNLLIYFGAELQQKVIPTFHYALKPGGFLFLGTSESINQYSDLFDAVEKKHRIFRATEHRSRQWSPVDIVSRSVAEPARDAREPLSGIQLRHRVERHILDRHTPSHVVVRESGEIVFLSGGTGRILEMPRGAPSRSLPDMVRRDLRHELRAALKKAIETRLTVRRQGAISMDEKGRSQRIDLTVEPLHGAGDGNRLYMVLFDFVEGGGSAPPSEPETSAPIEAAENEVRELRERLQGTVEEYETALEELKSSNEELVSVNEEAQSTNEELEASKEEMQSLNEELSTINAELGTKINELDRANADLRNLFEATQIASVFLDAGLVIRNFTPAAGELFGLRGADVGRPLSDLASVRDYPELQDQIESVFETGSVYEHRMTRSSDGTRYLVRLNPYVDKAGDTVGAVVTFVDVTSLARSEEHQQVLIQELNHRVKNMLAVVGTIVKSSLRKAKVARAPIDTLMDRLGSMSRAYALLTDSTWTRVNLREIAETELAAFGKDRITISGAPIDLNARQSLSISMVIHELATNAAKYGSLSGERGRLSLLWSQNGTRLSVEWTEMDGPRPKEPEVTGFGFQLIRMQVEQQLDGEMTLVFGENGLNVAFTFEVD